MARNAVPVLKTWLVQVARVRGAGSATGGSGRKWGVADIGRAAS
jgi:hypothetical protein